MDFFTEFVGPKDEEISLTSIKFDKDLIMYTQEEKENFGYVYKQVAAAYIYKKIEAQDAGYLQRLLNSQNEMKQELKKCLDKNISESMDYRKHHAEFNEDINSEKMRNPKKLRRTIIHAINFILCGFPRRSYHGVFKKESREIQKHRKINELLICAKDYLQLSVTDAKEYGILFNPSAKKTIDDCILAIDDSAYFNRRIIEEKQSQLRVTKKFYIFSYGN